MYKYSRYSACTVVVEGMVMLLAFLLDVLWGAVLETH